VFDGDDPHPRARLASAVMAATYVIVVATWDDVGDAVRMFGYCMMPLACIWFPAAMGDYTGSMTLRRSPAVFVFVVGLDRPVASGCGLRHFLARVRLS
jgi:hypothetical protein